MSKVARAGFSFGVLVAVTTLVLLMGSTAMMVQQKHGVLAGFLVFALMLPLWGALEAVTVYVAFQSLNKVLEGESQ